MEKRARIIKTFIITLYVLAILFPLFLPSDTTLHSQPAQTQAVTQQVINASSTNAVSTDQDFLIEKIIIFTSLFGVIGIAFLRWGFSGKKTANKTKAQENLE
ncbi:MAG: hypothetical protein EHM28_05190 [Spirochaetaceae bacterium]|nr:MAG: hypothetical protein EHM28_05190 [Spirochaetaceae bacterium]